MELLTLLATIAPNVLTFLIAHWDTVIAVVTAVVTLVQVLLAGQKNAVWPLALESVRKVADLELSGPEKRAKVVDLVVASGPAWVKLIPRQNLEQLVEQAYQFLRGELKQEGK